MASWTMCVASHLAVFLWLLEQIPTPYGQESYSLSLSLLQVKCQWASPALLAQVVCLQYNLSVVITDE